MEIREIKSQLSIVQVLQHYGLKPDKNQRLLCPFHPDKTPSLQIYPATNTYCCFSSNCTAGTGDAIQFIQLKENCNKHEALIKAGSLINPVTTNGTDGNTITPTQPSAARLFIEESRIDRIAVLTKFFTYYKTGLPRVKKAVDYLESRCIDYKRTEAAFNSGGLHVESKHHHLVVSMEKLGLLKPRPAGGYTVWAKDCIIFPLKNAENKIISLYGRSISNDTDQRHFYLSNRSGLYPGYPALQTKKLILTESIIDAASLLQQKEIKSHYEILSLYGTNGLTEEHLAAIASLPQLEEIILMLNADEAGEAATHKHAHTLYALLPHLRITHTSLPAGEDVNSVLCTHDDAGVLLNIIESRKDFSFSIENKKSELPETPAPIAKLDTRNQELLIYDPPTSLGTGNCRLRIEVWGGIKITGLDRMKVTLKVQHKEKQLLPIRDTLDLYSRQQTEHLIQTIAENFDANIKQTETTISELTNELENYRIKKIEALQPKEKTVSEITAAQRATAIAELKKEKLLERHNKMIGLTGIVGEEKNRMIAYLIYTMRKQQNPLHVMFLGASGSGKTYLQEKIAELIPEEDKMEITQITENALYYFKQEELKNKLIIFEDLDGALQVFYPMRELQTKKKISKTVTLKDSKGNLKTITIVVEGPVCISGCTTKEKLYEDNANRCILLYIDMTRGQDKKIMEYHAAVESGDIDTDREQQYKELFKNIQRVLRPICVNNPYSKFITLPEAVFKPRRTITLLRGFIKAIAFYHQYQREVKKDKHGGLYIEVTIEDIEAGFYYMQEVLFSKSDELTKATREFFEKLKTYTKENELTSFKTQDIRKKFRMEPRTIQRYMRELSQYSYIKRINGHKGRAGFEYTITDTEEFNRLKTAIDTHIEEVLHNIREFIKSSPTERT